LKLCDGAVAQLGERLVCNQEATGSIPVSSTKNSLCGGGALNYFIDRLFGLGPQLVPIVAVIVGGVIVVVSMVHKHRERLAKIERGIDPDGRGPTQRQ
jgi:hypothetical protein